MHLSLHRSLEASREYYARQLAPAPASCERWRVLAALYQDAMKMELLLCELAGRLGSDWAPDPKLLAAWHAFKDDMNDGGDNDGNDAEDDGEDDGEDDSDSGSGEHYNPNEPRDWHGRWTTGGDSTDGSDSESTQYANSGQFATDAQVDDDQPSIDRAVQALRDNAQPTSQSQCATYVREALNEGGFDVKPTPDAKDYGSSLENAGFQPLAVWSQQFDASLLPVSGYVPGYQPKAGDIAVIQPYAGGNPSGHMTMYDGSQWISDFNQRGLWPGPGYRLYKPNYVIYRHSN